MSLPLMAEGEFALVQQHLEKAFRTPAQLTAWGSAGLEHDLYALAAEAGAQQRDAAALRQYAPLAEEAATRLGHKLYQAIAHRAWGVAHRLAGDYAGAERRLNQALELFQGLETRWQTGRTLFEMGELATARLDTAGARDYFSRALAAFEEVEARPDAARTQALLEALAG